jgi:hypothetical protein
MVMAPSKAMKESFVSIDQAGLRRVVKFRGAEINMAVGSVTTAKAEG